MKPRVLIVAAPFGFGPAAKALILAHGLKDLADLTLFADREAWAFMDRHKPLTVASRCGIFGQVFSDRAALQEYDQIVSINHVPALVHLQALGLAKRTLFVDSLLAWREATTGTAVPPGLWGYLVQDYPGAAGLLDRTLAEQVALTAPLLWPLPPPDPKAIRHGVVLHLGGITSPLVSWAQVRGSISALVKSVIDAAATHDQALTVMGSAQLADRDLGHGPVSLQGAVSPESAARQIAGASVLITTPCIGAVFEALSQDTPVVLLPPMNSTQLLHHQVLTGAGLHSVLSSAHEAHLTAQACGLDRLRQTQLCLELLRQVAPQLAPALARRLSAVLASPPDVGGRDALLQDQRKLFAGLSPVQPLDVIRGWLLSASPARTLANMPAERTPMPAPAPAARPAPDPKVLQAAVKALPKVELHVHLEGSVPPELMLSLARRNRLKLPFDQPSQFRPQRPYGNFREFADRLLLVVHCLRQPQDFHDAVIVLGERLAQQNVVYAEVTWTPQFYLTRVESLDTLFAAMNLARARLKARWGLELRWIADLVRSYPAAANRVAQWASGPSTRASGMVALGLGGPEADHPAQAFEAVFRAARSRGLPANPHAGEGAGPDSVWQTLQALDPTRIGHGVRAIEDPVLVQHLANRALPLEVCLSSNVQLGLYPSLAEHPLRRLVEGGCKVSINTDDPVLFGTTLGREYLHAMRDCGMDMAFVRQQVLDALQSSYLEDLDKQRLIAECRRRFQWLDDGEPADPSQSLRGNNKEPGDTSYRKA
jgi:aminodeoxyfutalosine deaminase